MKKTEWFEGKIKPIREGIYEFYATFNDEMCIFNAQWFKGRWHVKGRGVGCWLNDEPKYFKWRGLARNPE